MNQAAWTAVIDAGRRGIEASECYKCPWPEPASSYELAKAAVQAAYPALREQVSGEMRGVLTSKSAIEAAAERIDPFAFDPKMVAALNVILLDSQGAALPRRSGDYCNPEKP